MKHRDRRKRCKRQLETLNVIISELKVELLIGANMRNISIADWNLTNGVPVHVFVTEDSITKTPKTH